MPVYEYACERCGPFAEIRPMAEYADPQPCPGCGSQAPRVILTAPMLATMDAGRRAAFVTNERSANEPRSSRATGHGPNCGCCGSGKKSRLTLHGADGSKSFPTSRPWMISH
jgi:putative FmdB family regulatory protein